MCQHCLTCSSIFQHVSTSFNFNIFQHFPNISTCFSTFQDLIFQRISTYFNIFVIFSAVFNIYQPISADFNLPPHFSTFSAFFQHVSACFSLFQHISIYFNLFQHFSREVSVTSVGKTDKTLSWDQYFAFPIKCIISALLQRFFPDKPSSQSM